MLFFLSYMNFVVFVLFLLFNTKTSPGEEPVKVYINVLLLGRCVSNLFPDLLHIAIQILWHICWTVKVITSFSSCPKAISSVKS